MRRMNRSRVTLAMMDAAAIAALRPSPPTTWRCRRAHPGTGKPSVRQTSGSGSSAQSACPSACRFDRCRPRRSISDAGTTHTATWEAHETTASKSSSRRASVWRLESSSMPRGAQRAPRRRSRSRQTAAATSGPASEPRPASSAPATRRAPRPRSCASRRRPGRVRVRRERRATVTAMRSPYSGARTRGHGERPRTVPEASRRQRDFWRTRAALPTLPRR
jgi:hypothetical protein